MSWRTQKIFTIAALAAALAINMFPERTEAGAVARSGAGHLETTVAQISAKDASLRAGQ